MARSWAYCKIVINEKNPHHFVYWEQTSAAKTKYWYEYNESTMLCLCCCTAPHNATPPFLVVSAPHKRITPHAPHPHSQFPTRWATNQRSTTTTVRVHALRSTKPAKASASFLFRPSCHYNDVIDYFIIRVFRFSAVCQAANLVYL